MTKLEITRWINYYRHLLANNLEEGHDLNAQEQHHLVEILQQADVEGMLASCEHPVEALELHEEGPHRGYFHCSECGRYLLSGG